jgi:hypothetical protein
LLAVAIVLFLALSWRGAAGKPERAYTVFLCGCLLFLGLDVVGHFRFNFRVIGEPHRLAPELDLAMTLAAVELLRRLWNWRSAAPAHVWGARAAVAIMVLFSAFAARHYVRHAWDIYPRELDYTKRVEYRMSDWVAAHIPQGRTFVAGSVRFWWDTWHDLAQTGGGSEQGVLNPHAVEAQWEVVLGSQPELGARWLAALGADAVIMTGPQSQDVYHDFHSPDKFAGVLPVLYDDGRGDVIYRVPRRYPSLARVVDTARLQALPPLRQTDLDRLRAYTAVVEEGPDSPAVAEWNGTDEMRVHARVAPGQSILVQVTYDPYWHAYSGSQALRVSRDPGADFNVIEAQPGEQDIRFAFEMPLENRIGWMLTWLSLAVCAAGLYPRRAREVPS